MSLKNRKAAAMYVEAIACRIIKRTRVQLPRHVTVAPWQLSICYATVQKKDNERLIPIQKREDPWDWLLCPRIV